jgi:hypothetical protein
MIQSLQRATMLTALVLLAACGNDGAGTPGRAAATRSGRAHDRAA